MKTSIIALAIITILTVNACGFEPVYAKKSVTSNESHSVQSKLNEVAISNIPDREGQILRNELIDRFYVSGRTQAPKYRLSILPPQEIRRELDITVGAEATRAQLEISTLFTLIDISNGKTMLREKAETFAGFNIIADEYSTRVSEKRTRENALIDVARQIEQKVAFRLSRE